MPGLREVAHRLLLLPQGVVHLLDDPLRNIRKGQQLVVHT
jgi:hypothetical protein